MEEITVDRATLKALGADTRVMILKSLSQRRRTQAELAHELGLAAPSINEHLHRLEEAGLIRPVDSGGRKWKYYELTEKGAAIVAPSHTAKKILFVLGSVLLLAAAAYFVTPGMLGGAFPQAGGRGQETLAQEQAGQPAQIQAAPAGMGEADGQRNAAGAQIQAGKNSDASQAVSSTQNETIALAPGEEIALAGGKKLRLENISQAPGSLQAYASFQLMDENGMALEHFSMHAESANYEKNGIELDVVEVVSETDKSYVRLLVRQDLK